MYINHTDASQLGIYVLGILSLKTDNNVFESIYNYLIIIFHSTLISSYKLIKSCYYFFSPHNLRSNKSNLSTVVFKPFASLFTIDIPAISRSFGNIKLISKIGLHTFLKITKVVLNGSSHIEFCTEWKVFTIWAVYTLCFIGILDEFKALYSLEEMFKIVINFLSIVAIAIDIKKSFVTREIESRENLFLLFEIFI